MAAADDAASYGATALLDSSVEASPTPAAAAAQPAAAQTSGARRLLIALLVLAALGVGIYFLGKHTEGVLQWQADLVDENRVLGVFACIGIFLPWIVLCLPTTLYEILVGYLFGVWQGALINAAGKLIGSNAAFFLGRYCFKQRVERLAAENWRVRRVQRLLAERPWGVAFLVRAAQIPIAVKNYGASGTPRPRPTAAPRAALLTARRPCSQRRTCRTWSSSRAASWSTPARRWPGRGSAPPPTPSPRSSPARARARTPPCRR